MSKIFITDYIELYEKFDLLSNLRYDDYKCKSLPEYVDFSKLGVENLDCLPKNLNMVCDGNNIRFM